MKTISFKATPNSNALSFKSALALLGQWFGAFILAMIVANIISPLPQFIIEKMPETGLMSVPSAMLFDGAVTLRTIPLWMSPRKVEPASAANARQHWLLRLANTVDSGWCVSVSPQRIKKTAL